MGLDFSVEIQQIGPKMRHYLWPKKNRIFVLNSGLNCNPMPTINPHFRTRDPDIRLKGGERCGCASYHTIRPVPSVIQWAPGGDYRASSCSQTLMPAFIVMVLRIQKESPKYMVMPFARTISTTIKKSKKKLIFLIFFKNYMIGKKKPTIKAFYK